MPARNSTVTERQSDRQKGSPLVRIVPDNVLGSAAISLLLTVPVGLVMVLIGVRLLVNYGWGLFVALPFTMGFAAALVYGSNSPRTLKGCVSVACLSIAVLGFCLLAVAVEGVLCLVMAAPIALPLAAFGGACGYLVQKRRWLHDNTPAFL